MVASIHRSAWKRNSQKFASLRVYNVRFITDSSLKGSVLELASYAREAKGKEGCE